MNGEAPILAAAVLLMLGVLASKASSRLGVPALLLFIAIGMLAGAEGPGGIAFDDFELAQTVGVLGLAFILFSGGLDTELDEVRPVLVPGALLATIGVALTAGITGLAAYLVLDLPLVVALLLGATVSSTDAAAVFSLLRSRGLGLRARLRPLLELESGSNDPMAVFLTIGLTELALDSDRAVVTLLPNFVQQMTVGAVLGYATARATVLLVNRVRLEYEGLYPVLTVATVLFVYGLAASLGGSGFLAVYVAGLAMSRDEFIHKRSLLRFHDGVAWLMQIAMFLALGLLVFPSQLGEVAPSALLVALVLVFVARPVAVFGTLPVGLAARDRLFVSWVGLRGAVPIILATFPLVRGVPEAAVIFNVVFFTVLTSVLLQGTTIPLVARLLGVDAPVPPQHVYPLEFVGTGEEDTDMVEMVVDERSAAVGAQVVDLGLPEGALIVLLNRRGTFLVPRGGTLLHPGDRLLVFADRSDLFDIRGLIEAPPAGQATD